MIDIVLIGRIPSKKNSRQTDTRTGRTFPSVSYRTWHRAAMAQLMIQKCPRNKIRSIGISIVFYFGDNRACDLTNKAESVMDLLVDYGVLKDDCWQYTGTIQLTGCHTAKKPGASIYIFEK
jgi:Holliday junction resolvase RusA-like endonuclease